MAAGEEEVDQGGGVGGRVESVDVVVAAPRKDEQGPNAVIRLKHLKCGSDRNKERGGGALCLWEGQRVRRGSGGLPSHHSGGLPSNQSLVAQA